MLGLRGRGRRNCGYVIKYMQLYEIISFVDTIED
jgi:hypothetical protein